MSMRYPGGFIASTPVTAAYPSGVWTQAQAIPYQAQNVWTRDQYWPYTTLLLQGNGTNGAQNNTFLDSSSNNFTITRNGNTTQGSFTPYEQDGYWSNYFNGSSYLTFPNNSSLAFGTGAYTIEFWVNSSGPLSDSFILSGRAAIGTLHITYGGFGGTTAGSLRFVGSSTITSGSVLISNGAWNHCAIVRDGSSNITLYVNGASVGTGTDTTNYTATSGTWYINANDSGPTAGSAGYISNLRILKGTALYTSAFIPPVVPLTAITNTSLLTCQSNRFKDNSTNNFAITVNGSPSVQAFQPFPGATTWSASVLGGSGYFDGSGDFLNYTDSSQLNFGTGSYTIEFWIYGPSNNDNFILGNNNTSTIQITTGGSASTVGALRYVAGGNVTTSGSVLITDNAWHHCAIVRNGSSNVTLYVDGVSVGTGTDSTNYTSTTSTVTIAKHNSLSSNYLTGYLSNLRIVKGTAVYTSAFTPPAAPLTAISGTSLLLNFTNAGIYDNSMMNNLETVGNAQVSTSVVKYGTGSISLDGTGDWLIGPASPNLVANGDFTVEAWVYMNANSGSHTVISYTNTSGQTQWGLFVGLITSGKASFYWVNTSPTGFNATGTTTIPTGQWVHIAGTLQGTTLRVFVNGVLEGTGTTSGSARSQSSPLLFVGQSGVGAETFNGYIDDLRITKGAARYIGNFTPPVARMPQQ